MDENTVANVITISRSAENERFFAKLISRAMYPSCMSLFWTLFLPAIIKKRKSTHNLLIKNGLNN